ncbi:MAG TPA: 1-deoxy-D-xylulose-5-phosphate synthase, partial [Chloroflexota bacterium]|nr:1-deoxy-D-xylulose-5-phosphate synthase [Chloroflexota bacterium]
DNEMSISPNVGALSRYMSRRRADPQYARRASDRYYLLAKIAPDRALNGFVMPTMWEELGFVYTGPVDGHDLAAVIDALENAAECERPIVVHISTTKGKGYAPAEADAVALHGVSAAGASKAPSSVPAAPAYQKVFGDTMIELARRDPRMVVITAAMAEGTGLAGFAKELPKQFFDVGIAEGHAVTFAAGLATQGLRPVAAIYSTFLQRAYDSIIHDVCIQNLPVLFALDRAGIVGEDGRTHQGMFDFAYLRCIPNMVVMAPKNENELRRMLATGLAHNGPSAVRYPRGSGVGVPLDVEPLPLDIGRAEVICEGDDLGIIAIGAPVNIAMEAAERLGLSGISTGVINARFVKPLDEDTLLEAARRYRRLVTIEEHVVAGGFGSAVLELLSKHGSLAGTRVLTVGLSDAFIEHGGQGAMRREAGMDLGGVLQSIAAGFPELGIRQEG